MILFTIASREMAERKLVWAAAALVGLAGAVLPWMRGLMGLARGDERVAAVAFIMVSGLTLAAVLGAAMIPSDLAGRRMGFFLARPVPIATLLGGRFLGAWLLAAGAAGLVALFQVVLHPRSAGQWAEVTGLAALLGVPVLFLFHYLGVLWRARSPWALLDLSAMGGFLWLLAWMAGRLALSGAWEAVPWFAAAAALAVPLVLALAAYFQMERGRADLRRGHRAMTLTVASGLLVVALAGLALKAWAGASGPSTLSTYRLWILAPKGDWVFLTGTGRFHPQAFLLNTATGAFLPQAGGGRFSGDGRHFLRTEIDPGSSLLELVDVDLGVVPPRERPVGTYPLGKSWMSLAQVSPDGHFGVLRKGKELLVVDLASGRKVGEETAPAGFGSSLFRFPAAAVLREYRPIGAGGTEIREWDLHQGTCTLTGLIRMRGTVQPCAAWVLVAGGGGFTVCDGRTGAVAGQLLPAPGGAFDLTPRPMADGSFAVVERRSGGALLRILEGTGREVAALPLPGVTGCRYQVFPEAGTGRVFLNEVPPPGAQASLAGRILVADPVRHALTVTSVTALLPEGAWSPEDGPLATRLQVERGGGFTVVAPGGASRHFLGTARESLSGY